MKQKLGVIILFIVILCICCNCCSCKTQNAECSEYLKTKYQNSAFSIVNVKLKKILRTDIEKNPIEITVQLRYDDKQVSNQEKIQAALEIRNLTQEYLMKHDDDFDGSSSIVLNIISFFENEKATPCIFPCFTNQYSHYLDINYDQEKISSLKLDTVIASTLTLNEKELEIFSDAKSMILDITKIQDFSVFEKFINLKYLSVTKYNNNQIEQCVKYLPNDCKLYTGKIVLSNEY